MVVFPKILIPLVDILCTFFRIYKMEDQNPLSTCNPLGLHLRDHDFFPFQITEDNQFIIPSYK